ncbi:hypothetical protein ASG11_02840 [Sphingomonas sp. Leaf357]|uniref:hypothetical protein n=1 Tax=Sphingomonas sp. Leaf357 TaxID=1736350 RepID=UPI0006F79E5A|nr:hypothetical protein [Sphingomonas sp. Leaf357]KQS03325.1 hypothetical protein ASG11_02840 [Sphingomonas sp. Leaf357]
MALIDPIKNPLGTIRKQPTSFYRRLGRWWTATGSLVFVFASVLAVVHYGYGVPMYDKNNGQISDPTAVAAIIAMLGFGGLFVAMLGILILRTFRSHNPNGN